jgi:glycine betaine/proline transport system substrate-binding protein
MKVYDLDDDVNLIKASYSASMAQALANYQSGKPVFFYTWAPNWTIYKLKPGEDVMWINVPEIKPDEAQKDSVDRMTVSGVKGAVSDPLKAGFVVSDIRIVANKKFANDNPAAKKFFELFHLSLEDINAQNAKMQNGEDSQQDIERQAREWVKAHQDQWNDWLKQAREAAM